MDVKIGAMGSPPAVGQEPDVRVQVKLVCSHCRKVFVRHSRRGYTARCPHCGTVNAGPALLAEQAKPTAEGAIQRRASRRPKPAAAAAEPPAGEAQPGAPAPVRRKRSAPARSESQPGNEAKGAVAAPQGRPAGGPGPARRRGLLDRLVYGDEDE
jgi:phage FluMu protein Com